MATDSGSALDGERDESKIGGGEEGGEERMGPRFIWACRLASRFRLSCFCFSYDAKLAHYIVILTLFPFFYIPSFNPTQLPAFPQSQLCTWLILRTMLAWALTGGLDGKEEEEEEEVGVGATDCSAWMLSLDV